MISKKGQSYMSITVLIVIVLSISIFGLAYKDFASDLYTSEHTNLDTQSQSYISNDLYGLNITYNDISNSDKEEAPYLLRNESQSSKDYSLEFQYGKDKSESIWTTAFDIYNAPTMFLTLFGLNGIIPTWLQGIISTFLYTLVTVGIVFFVRGIR